MPPAHGLRPLITAVKYASPVPHVRREICMLSEIAGRTSTTNLRQFTGTRNLSTISTRSLLERKSGPKSLRIQQRFASSSSSEIKRTPLYDVHTSQGAKMVPFASYSMPLEYSDQSHSESHKWTRSHASLFDVSHMVQHKLSGELAEEFLMSITPSSINSLEKHHSTLSCLLSDSGGIVDDTVITRLGRDSFYFVTNAGCRESDLSFIQTEMDRFLASKSAAQSTISWHVLDHHSLIALQGPESANVLQSLVFNDTEDDSTNYDLSSLYFGTSRWLQLTLPDETNTPSLLISRTGYTGEDGFEISIPPEHGDSTDLATGISNALTSHDSVRWAGLAARDSLRLEAGMCLYGHDINTDITPPMAALGWIVGQDRRSASGSGTKFNGHETILAQLGSPKTMQSRRVGFVLEKGPAAREGAEIVNPDKPDEVLGKITSGCPSPSMDGANIAMGYIRNGWHKRGTKVGVKVRKGVRSAEVSKMPFVESQFYRP